MKIPHFVIAFLLLQQSISANAQVSGRQGNANTNPTVRNTQAEKKKMIGMKYDSLINNSEQQINKLSSEISGLQQQITDLKKQIKKTELDYANSMQTGSRSMTREQSQQKKKEYDKKINELNILIKTHKTDISNKEYHIKELKSEINTLKKEKEETLNKL